MGSITVRVSLGIKHFNMGFHSILMLLGCAGAHISSLVQMRELRQPARRHGFDIEQSELNPEFLRTQLLLCRPLGLSHCLVCLSELSSFERVIQLLWALDFREMEGRVGNLKSFS